MHRALHAVPNTPSWCGAHLKHRDNLTFTFVPCYGYGDIHNIRNVFWEIGVRAVGGIVIMCSSYWMLHYEKWKMNKDCTLCWLAGAFRCEEVHTSFNGSGSMSSTNKISPFMLVVLTRNWNVKFLTIAVHEAKNRQSNIHKMVHYKTKSEHSMK